jgi:putative phosphoesterase
MEKLLSFMRNQNITVLIHAGDFMTAGIGPLLMESTEIKFYIARGNCDFDSILLKELQKRPNIEIATILNFEIEGTRFIVSHVPDTASRAAWNNPSDVVIHGHTHQARIETLDNTLFLNPGSLMDGHGFFLLDLPSLAIERRFRLD